MRKGREDDGCIVRKTIAKGTVTGSQHPTKTQETTRDLKRDNFT